ncbi:hypothetical protein NDI85_03245 [Halomicroarcula sp. S1AR25-4]|uniref:DUF7344 domain-containing protein n=1 Tax=Haloarcula sp. S1AR25-4 TaxID=2950538 RepID=UPI00287437C1|nr:hypothetical protein [Halomicroarcula sp. S1AR25-4]MDS0276795.1 hypothetical protein [Halomicroarcula sp. S1AR25-4]
MRDQQNARRDADPDEPRTDDSGFLQTFCDDDRTATDPPSSLGDGVIFDVLRNDRRRAALRVLQPDTAVTVRLLAEQVAAWENDTTPDALREQQRKRVYVSLHQSHLPKMDDLDIVEFDREAATVSLGSAGDDVLRYVDGKSDGTRAWYRYYAAIALTGATLLAAQVTLLPSASSAPITVAVLVAVGACTALYWACDSS